MKKSPLAQVTEQFGSKDKLVDALLALPASILDRPAGADDKDAFRNHLKSASNAKLLKLIRTTQTITERFGSKDKLIGKLLDLRHSAKDNDFKAKLGSLSIGRLLDQVTVLEKQRKQAAPNQSATPKKS